MFCGSYAAYHTLKSHTQFLAFQVICLIVESSCRAPVFFNLTDTNVYIRMKSCYHGFIMSTRLMLMAPQGRLTSIVLMTILEI